MYQRLTLKIYRSLIVWLYVVTIGASPAVMAARFTPTTEVCTDSAKICVDNAPRIIDGLKVTRDCWGWTYSKTCKFPSKDNCKDYANCYVVGDLPCLLTDAYGNCVNLQKEFSCKSWEPITINTETVREDVVAKEGNEHLVCKGVPCLDGNCVDKKYQLDTDMLDSVSKLSAFSQMKGVDDLNYQLFTGFAQSCSKKATSYTNCCSTSLNGWGSHLGAKCTTTEKDLVEMRLKNLCVYSGKENHRVAGVTTRVTHHYCCFGSLFNKVFQVEGRKQLGLSFGNGDSPDCRGLTLAEIMKLDIERMDLSEFYVEIVKRMQVPNVADINHRVNSSLPKIKTYDGSLRDKGNKQAGINNAYIKDDLELNDE